MHARAEHGRAGALVRIRGTAAAVAVVRRGALVAALAGASLASARCACEEPPVTIVDAGQIGDGTPVDLRDAGDPYQEDAGPVACEEDGNEDNDERAAATALSSAAPTVGTFCGGDDDWYSLDVAAGCSLSLSLRFDAVAAGDLDLLALDPDGLIAGSANTLDDGEDIDLVAQRDGAYAVRVRGGSRDAIAYTLTATATCAADLVCPDDDRFEDNDDADSPGVINGGAAVDGIVCSPDEDWFAMPGSLGCIADAVLTFEDDSGDIDLELYRADGTRVGRSAGVDDAERVTKVVTEAGMRYRVLLFTAGAANPYRLVIDETCAGEVVCPSDDPFEPNDTRAQAVALSPELDEIVGAVCGTEDFFDFTPTTGCALHAELAFVDAEGDLDLQLVDNDDAVVASSAGTGDLEVIDHTAANGGVLALRVFGFSGAQNDYRLRLTQTCP